MSGEPMFLIWSHEHAAWWKPARWGYTHDPRIAGHYTQAAAEQICENASYRWLRGWKPPYGDLPAEVMVPSPGAAAIDSMPFDELTLLLAQMVDAATRGVIDARDQAAKAGAR